MIRRDFNWMALLALAGFRPNDARAEEPALPAAFDVVDQAHDDRFVARIQVDSSGRIAVERSDPRRRQWFSTIVTEMNKQETILLPAPPPSSAPRLAMYGFPIERSDPRFLSAMKLYLHRYHALELR